MEGKSGENLWNTVLLLSVFLSFWTVCAYPKLKQQQKICFRQRLVLIEQKKGSGFGQ